MNATVQEGYPRPLAEAKGREAPLGFVDILLWSTLVFSTLGFCVYHYSLLNGIIPPILGGYAAAASVLVLPIVLPIYLHRASTKPEFLTIADLLFAMFTVMVVIVALISRSNPGLEDVANFQLSIVPQFVAWFALFRCVRLGATPLRIPSVIAFGLMTIILLIRPSLYLASVSDIATMFRDDVADYQAYAFVYLVMFIYILGIVGRSPLRYFIYAAGLVALFVNGARSELIAAPLVIVTFEIFFAVRFPAILATVIIGGLLSFGPVFNLLANLFPENRFISLLTNVGSDQSYSERSYFFERALSVISESPFWGNYGAYPLGEYAHNIVSVWVDFGLIGFLLFAFILFLGLANSLKAYRENRDLHLSAMLAATALCMVMLSITAKYWTYQMFPILLALQARLIYWRNSAKGRIS
ncbi:MAG: hypothetical protein EON59_03660 [Alphaproteobacteria bacterium]|nr:MAG: hypothetical protein EON59_03660 [Alphaproteobacteria bacterium]